MSLSVEENPNNKQWHSTSNDIDSPTGASANNQYVTPIKLNQLVINPQKFIGIKQRPREWLLDFQHAIDQNCWSDDQVVKYFSAFLEGSALDWYRTNAMKKINAGTTWSNIKTMFEDYYLADISQISLLQQLEEIRQKEDSISIFIPKIVKLMTLINSHVSEEEIIWRIKTKLKPALQKMLATSQIKTIDELNRLGKSCELTLENLTTISKPTKSFDKDIRNNYRNNELKNEVRKETMDNKVTTKLKESDRELK